MNIHKDMRINDGVYQAYKNLFVTVHPKIACKLGFPDHLWLPFFDKPQSDIVVFEIITFQIYNIMVTKCKNLIGTHCVIKFDDELELISISIKN